jgi:hypothetical protein
MIDLDPVENDRSLLHSNEEEIARQARGVMPVDAGLSDDGNGSRASAKSLRLCERGRRRPQLARVTEGIQEENDTRVLPTDQKSAVK